MLIGWLGEHVFVLGVEWEMGVHCGGSVERIIRYNSVAQDLDGRYSQELLAEYLVEVPGGCALTCRLFRINQRGTDSPVEL